MTTQTVPSSDQTMQQKTQSNGSKTFPAPPLTKDQESLLVHGPKFAISPKQPPAGENIVAVEQACSKLNQGESEDLRVEVKKALMKAQRPPANISKEEYKALNELKKDNSRMILTTDKWVVLVIMDKADYTKNVEELLNKPTYKKIPEDPTSKQKNKLTNILKNIKTEGGLSEEAYRRLYPLGQGHPNCMGFNIIKHV